MRKMISGMVAAVAVMMTAGAAPANACGGLFTSCSPCGYSACAPAPVYVAPVATGCYTGCGWGHERLADPMHQYYYVNQGPTHTGPGNWAPEPAYEEDALPAYGGYGYGRSGYGYGARGYGYGYGVRGYGVRPAIGYGYGARYGARYGYGVRHGFYGARHGGAYRGAYRGARVGRY